jgi:8-oxo-dGTP pyrophosphatase MutT (NUDIX family)
MKLSRRWAIFALFVSAHFLSYFFRSANAVISADLTRDLSLSQPSARVGVAVLIIRDGRVLLIRRSGSHGAGSWATPSGHLDFGETPEQCGIREAHEETGVEVADLTFMAITNHLFEIEQKHYIA